MRAFPIGRPLERVGGREREESKGRRERANDEKEREEKMVRPTTGR